MSHRNAGQVGVWSWLRAGLAVAWVASVVTLQSNSASAAPIPGSVIWLDASDVDGDGNPLNNPANGTPITSWFDKGTVQGGQHAVSAGSPPTYLSSFQNGQSALSFNGTQGLVTPNVNMGDFTYFTVHRSTSGFLIAERGADINTAANGEFLNTTTGSTFRAKRPGGDLQKDYIAGWGNTGVSQVNTWAFGGTDPSHQLFVNGTQVAMSSNAANPGSGAVSEPLFVGSRVGNTIGVNGQIAELIAFPSRLNTAQINIVNNYLSSKYNSAISNDFYSGDTPGNNNYDFGVFGIGRTADGTVSTGSFGQGLTLGETGGTLGVGEYLLAGHRVPTNSETAADVPSGFGSRWSRVFYLDKTSTNGIDGSLTFDLSDAGLTSDAVTFGLLYSATDPYNFSVLGTSSLVGDQVSFLLGDALLQDGYYTLASIAPLTPEPSTWLLVSICLGAGATVRFVRRNRNTPAA